MKHQNLVGALPQQLHQPQCLVCKKTDPKVYGRFAEGIACSRHCNDLWSKYKKEEHERSLQTK